MHRLVGKCILIKMITRTFDGRETQHKRKLFFIALVFMIVVCDQVAPSSSQLGGEQVAEQQQLDQNRNQHHRGRFVRGEERTASDNQQGFELEGFGGRRAELLSLSQQPGLVDARDLPLLLALKRFCSRQPPECDQSVTDQLDTLNCQFAPNSDANQDGRGDTLQSETNGIICTTTTRATTSMNAQPITPTIQMYSTDGTDATGNQIDSETVTNTTADDLDRVQGSWARGGGGLATTNMRLPQQHQQWQRQQQRAQAEPARRPTTILLGHQRLTTRSWRQPPVARVSSNTYRVSLEEARRFVRAQQRQQASFEMGTMAPAALYSDRVVAPLVAGAEEPPPRQHRALETNTNEQSLDYLDRLLAPARTTPAAISAGDSNEENDDTPLSLVGSRAPLSIRLQRSEQPRQLALLVPKRTGSSVPESPFGSATAAATTTTSGHRLVRQRSNKDSTNEDESIASTTASTTTTGASESKDAMTCNLRYYSYTATKTDGRGNSCSGLIKAAICYGGCDTGEISDWLFPYKKSIHKVCRHGGRERRRTHLDECRSATGGVPEGEIEASLREYYYVEARDCVCKKCTSVDTNCLGTMTKPHLPSLRETAAELAAASSTGAAGGGD